MLLWDFGHQTACSQEDFGGSGFILPPSSCLRVNMGCALVILFQVCSLYVPTKDRSPFTGPFLGVPSLLITLQNGQIHLSIEAQCDHHNYKMAYLHFLHVIKFHPLPDRGMGSSIFAFLHPRSCS